MRSWRTSAELQLVRHVHSLHSTSIVLSLPSFLFGGPALHTQTLYHHKMQNIYIILMHQPSINIILDLVAVRTAVSLDPSSRLRWSSNQRIPTYKMEQLRWAEGTPQKNNLWKRWIVDTSQHYPKNCRDFEGEKTQIRIILSDSLAQVQVQIPESWKCNVLVGN